MSVPSSLPCCIDTRDEGPQALALGITYVTESDFYFIAGDAIRVAGNCSACVTREFVITVVPMLTQAIVK